MLFVRGKKRPINDILSPEVEKAVIRVSNPWPSICRGRQHVLRVPCGSIYTRGRARAPRDFRRRTCDRGDRPEVLTRRRRCCTPPGLTLIVCYPGQRHHQPVDLQLVGRAVPQDLHQHGRHHLPVTNNIRVSIRLTFNLQVIMMIKFYWKMFCCRRSAQTFLPLKPIRKFNFLKWIFNV